MKKKNKLPNCQNDSKNVFVRIHSAIFYIKIQQNNYFEQVSHKHTFKII